MTYKIATAGTLEELVQVVQEAINDGYRPQGSPSYVHQPNTCDPRMITHGFMQALLKDSRPNDLRGNQSRG